MSALVVVPFFLVVPLAASNYSATLKWGATVLLSCVITLAVLYIPLLGGGSDLLSLQVFANSWRFNPLGFALIEMLVPLDAQRYFAAVVILSTIFIVWLRWINRANRTLPPIDIALFLLIFFSPVVNGWYWLWLLPLAFLHRRPWLLLFVIFSVLGYCTLGNLFPNETADVFIIPGVVTLLQMAILVFLLIRNFNINRYQKMCNNSRAIQSINAHDYY